MWQFLRENQFVVGALTGSLAAFLLGLWITYLRRDKRWLGFTSSSRNVVQRGHSKMSVRYEDREIARLDSHTVVLRNIGNKPLVKLPVSLQLPSSGSILEYETSLPEGSATATELEAPDKIVVTLDLLNPGESLSVGITVADCAAESIKVIARAELLEVREMKTLADPMEVFEAMARASPVLGGLNLGLFRLIRKLSVP